VSVGVTFSVVLAAERSRAVPPATRFQAQIAVPVLSEVVASTTDLTDEGQFVAAPVLHVICVNETTPEEAVGSDCDWRA
jgi:hypothetical protein